ncbi:MAG: adenylyltransferase/cytidyltransferase family protein [Nanoarchaeota archaeon]
MTTVLTFGTFDLVHPGHLDYFRQARQLGDRLIILVARDTTVAYVKGKMPMHHEKERLARVKEFSHADDVFLGSFTDFYNVLDKVKPDVIALGYDQTAFVDKIESELKKRGLQTKIVRCKPFHPDRWKTSKIQQNLGEAAR